MRYLRRRFVAILALVGVSLGVMVLISVTSVMNGFGKEMKTKIRGTLSHINISRGQNKFISNYEKYRDRILKVPHVTGCSPHIEWMVMFDLDKGADYATMIGMDMAAEQKVSGFGEFLMDGSPDFLVDGAKTSNPPIIVGCGVFDTYLPKAEKMPCPYKGSEFLLVTGRPENKMASWGTKFQKFSVAGWFSSGLVDFDRHTMVVPMGAAQDFLGIERDTVTNFRISVDNYEDAAVMDAVRRDLINVFKDYTRFSELRMNTWEDERRNLLAAVKVEKVLQMIILFFIILVAGFILLAVLTMMVAEKKRDIGILLSLGASMRGIMGIFWLEGLIISSLGSGIGFFFGYLITEYINEIERFLSAAFGTEIFPRDIYLLDKIPSEREPTTLAIIIGLTILAGLVFSIYPAFKAARTTPMEALRYE